MDALRSWVRDLIGYRSPLYVSMANALSFYYAFSREGLAGMRLLKMRSGSGQGTWIKFRNLLFPIFIRPGTADVESVIDNIFREEYGQFPKGFSPKVIVDAGAYIGDTSAYFLSRFRDARVLALEPNLESYELARGNLAHYLDRVSLLQKAMWNTDGVVYIAGDETGASVGQEGIPVETIKAEGLMQLMGVERLELLKVDIEGAEIAVLESGVDSWLRRVDVLLLETHGKEIEGRLIPMLQREGFRVRRHRNVWYCVNQQLGLESEK